MRPLAVLPLVLLSATSVVAEQSFREYAEEILPSCVIDCAANSLNNVTECGSDPASSNNKEDIDCICGELGDADRSFVRELVENISGCMVDADCSEDDLDKINNLDAESFQESVCESGGGDSNGDSNDSMLSGFTIRAFFTDSYSDGAALLSAGSTFLFTAGAAGFFAIF